jgi:hypothetical protein
MATLAINGGIPVRSAPYPSWPETDDDEYAADGVGSPSRVSTRPRSNRRSPRTKEPPTGRS